MLCGETVTQQCLKAEESSLEIFSPAMQGGQFDAGAWWYRATPNCAQVTMQVPVIDLEPCTYMCSSPLCDFPFSLVPT